MNDNKPDNHVDTPKHRWQAVNEGYKINLPQSSNWKCHMFGKNAFGGGFYYTPPIGGVPNWFHRKMQGLILGHVWEKV